MKLLDGEGRLLGRWSVVDLAALLLLFLLLAPAVRTGAVIYSATPRVSRVVPEAVLATTEGSQTLTIHGKWFNPRSTVKLGGVTLPVTAATPQRLEARIAPEQFYPGRYPLMVVNERGLSASWKEAVQVYEPAPEIERVSRRKVRGGEELVLSVVGRNFQKDSTVSVGTVANLPQVKFISPRRLRAAGSLPWQTDPGLYPVRVTNHFGSADVFPDAVEVLPLPALPVSPVPPAEVLPLPALPVSPVPPAEVIAPESVPLRPKSEVAVAVVCAFSEPKDPIRARMLRKGAVSFKGGRVTARIVEILARPPGVEVLQRPGLSSQILRTRRRLVLAAVLLRCKVASTGAPQWIYEGEAVGLGKLLPFTFGTHYIAGMTIVDPMPLEGGWEDHVPVSKRHLEE